MDPILDYEWLLTRRHFLEMATTSVGVAALATLFNEDPALAQTIARPQGAPGLAGLQQIAPKAKRVIYLFQSGAPSQHEWQLDDRSQHPRRRWHSRHSHARRRQQPVAR